MSRAQFTVDREPPGPSSRKTGLAITEIMYNPRAIPGLATNLTHEFIELFNSKPWDEDISGFAIDGTVHYAFPSNTILHAGAYVVVARVPGLIQTNYGITNVLGPWDGATTNRLSTEAGLVRLRNRQGAVLLEINYRDSPPWPEAADGAGHSISLVRPSWGEDNYQAWAESDSIGGSPGGPDPLTLDPLRTVYINEFQNHADPIDWVELYNHSNQPVDLSGAYLSDDPLTNKFRIPDGTVIPARGFVTWDQAQLGFELFAGGETLFFWNSNATRVIDVVDFRGSSNNVTQGRYPDGGPFVNGLTTPTRGAPNAVPARYPVVINELMFNPISGNSDDEYVEIYNRTASAQNIAGYEFVVGITYVFATNALTQNMPAGAHWVIAKNPTNLAAIYNNLSTNVNLFGPYGGTLANGGERIVLAAADYDFVIRNGMNVNEKLPVPVSDFTYGDGGRWGNWVDGLGSSLELIDPEGDLRHPQNWADSNDTGESQWTAIEYNGPLGETLGSPINDSVMIMAQGLSEFLVDEVEVRIDNGPNLVVNGGFESGLSGWSLQGSHDFSTIENEGFAGGKCLHVRAGSRGDNQSNRILSPPFASAVTPGPHNVSVRAKVRWLRGFPEVLLRLHGSATEAYGRMSLPRKLGTPGTTNSVRVANLGPAVYEVKHSPLLPGTNEDVVVTARAIDRQGVAAMTLRYRIDPTPTYTDVAMVDNGTGADAIANDGIYSAVIPGQAGGDMAAFYVQARDNLNALGTFPQFVFPPAGLTRCWPNDAVARECVVRWGEVQMPGDFATYHLWVTQLNSNRWHNRNPLDNAPMDGTFIYNNSRAIYNALPLFSGSPFHRTNSTTGPAGPYRVDYVMNLPDDDQLLGSTDFVLNNPGNPDRLTVSDLSAVAESTVYKIFEGLGLPNNHRRFIHFFVNGSQRSTAYERTGNFIFEDSQQPNGDVVTEWFPNDAAGQLFKVEDWFEFDNNGFDVEANNDADLARRTIMLRGQPTFVPAPYRFMFRKRSVSVGNSANDYSTIFALIDAASPPDNPTNSVVDPDVFATVADYEAWMRHFAVQRTVGNFDSYGWNRGKNDYLYRTTNGFAHLPWDIDYSLGLGRPANEPLFESSDPRIVAMFNTPVIVRAYWRAFNDLVNGPFSNESLDPFIDARANALLANNINIDLDAVASIKTYIGQRRAYLQSQLATVDVPFALDGPPFFETQESLFVLTGTAPVGIKTILLNGVSYPMTWLDASHFVMRFGLHTGYNTYTLQGYDRFGAIISNAVASVTAFFTDPEPDPTGAFVISEIMFAPATTNAQFIEIVNRSQNTFDLTGWRVDGAGVTFPLGSVITNGQTIVLAQNRSAFLGAYGSVPVFAVFNTALSLQGQRLALVRPTPSGVQFLDAVRYDTVSPWPGVAVGSSLQLIDAAQDNDRVSNWGVDLVTRATPGASNSVAAALTPPFDPLWLNELQTESLNGPLDNFGEREPWLEIYNAGAVALDLSGYYLATQYTSNLTEWAFPPGATINAGEHKLIWADGEPGESIATDLHTSFRLESAGSLALVRLTNGQPQITDYLTWTNLGPNISYGGAPDGQASSRFILHSPSPRDTNSEPKLRVFINEWMTRNTSSTFRDPADNNSDDWFEIFNAESFTVDLSNYYLTDDAFNTTKYHVPNNGQYRIAPGGFLLVWADNQTGQNNATRADLHVNFQLSSSSGVIGLYAPDGTNVVDAISYGLQTSDISEGRYTDGSSNRYFMPKSTGRGPNSIPGYNAPPKFPFITNRFALPGQNLFVSIKASDPDTNTLTYIIDAAPAGATVIQATAGFRWIVPTNQPLGIYPVALTVVDNGSPSRSNSTTFTITVGSPSNPSIGVTGPVIYSPVNIGGQATFTFDTIVGHTYRVFYKDDLSAPTWTELDRDFVAANSSTSLTDGMAAPQRFYIVQQVD